MKTTADSPGSPMNDNAGERKLAIRLTMPQYWRKLTIKLIGNIIFKSHQIVLPALGIADVELLNNRLYTVFIMCGL